MTGGQPRLAVLGAGAWGTALAATAARAGNTVSLWARDPDLAAELNDSRTNERYLPGIRFDAEFAATANLASAVEGTDIVLAVVPAQALSTFAPTLVPLVEPGTAIVGCAKGIDRRIGRLPHETLGQALPDCRIATLSGPSFAADVARGLPTAVTVACDDMELSASLARRLSSPAFRCYAADDLRGVELGGALKNVLALAVGAARGLKLGASAEAALIARGFAELGRLARALGARSETLMGLSGLGDLVLTCSGPQSRNFAYGIALGEAASLEGRPLAEGVATAAIASQLANDNDVDTPVIDAVAQVVERKITAREAVAMLLERPLRNETL